MSIYCFIFGFLFFVLCLFGVCAVSIVLGAGAMRDEEQDRALEEAALKYYREHGKWKDE